MALVTGGYVINLAQGRRVQLRDVSQDKLREIAVALGVTDLNPDDKITTIFCVAPKENAKEKE